MKALSIDRVRFGSFEFDRLNRLLYREGAELSLPPRAIAVLSSLIDRPGQIVPKQVLLDEVWKDANVTETSLTEAVSLLRQALADDPQRPAFIQTVPRRGYRFVAPLTAAHDADTWSAHLRDNGRIADEGRAIDDSRLTGNGVVDEEARGANGFAGSVTDRVGDAGGRRGVASAVEAEAVADRVTTAAALGHSTATATPTAAPSAAPVSARDARIAAGAAANTAGAAAAAAGVAAAPDTADAAADAGSDATWPAWLPWLFVGVTLVALSGIVLAVLRQPSTYVRPVVRFSVDVPGGLQLVTSSPAIALSRDGRRVAFAARRGDGPPRLYVRDMDRLDPIVLADTDGAAAPFFSPDGRWVGFFADGSLKKIAVDGGPPVTLCAARAPLGAVWSTRRFIVFAGSLTGGLSRVHENGGRPVVQTTPDPAEGEVRHAWPDILPDDLGVVFTGVAPTGGPEASRIAAVSLDTGRVQTLVNAGVSPHYVPTGHLLFARTRTVFAAPFDPDARELLGPALPVLEDVVTDDPTGAVQFTVAAGGHAAVLRSARPETTAVYTWLRLAPTADTRTDANGARARAGPQMFTAPFPAREVRGLSLSPDGSRLAVSLGDGHRTDIWVSDVARGDLQRLTSDGQNLDPVWTTDSRRLVFASRRADGPFTLVMKTIDEAASSSVAIAPAARQPHPTSASADGLVYVDAQPATGLDLWFLPWSGGAARPLVQTPSDETAGAISPDGRWLAYQSNDSGRWMVMLQPLDRSLATSTSPARVAPSDGARVAWSPDGRQILFTHEGRLLQISFAGAPLQPVGPPRAVADGVDASDGFGLTRDGRVFVRTRDKSADPTRLEVVLDWSRELSARVPIRPRPPRPVR